MKKLWKEFKEFAFKGNVISMAVGIVIGGAFTAIVNGLVQSIIMPLLSLITGSANVSDMKFMIGATEIPYGAFLQAVIDFFLIALVLFLIVRAIDKATPKKPEPPKKAPRLCPFCKTEIPEGATRCPHCTSELK